MRRFLRHAHRIAQGPAVWLPAWLCLLGALVAGTPVLAQPGVPAADPLVMPLRLSPDLAVTQFIHEAWGVKDGLPQSNVNAVLQTRDGYLWLATQEGLVRFDGVRFTVFDRTQVEGMENHIIRVLAESRDGTLWIGTEGGLTRYRDGRFDTFTTRDGLSDGVIRALYEDSAGHLWIGTLGDGVFRYDGTRFTPIAPEPPASDAAALVLSLAESPDGSMLVGTAGGLFRVRDGAMRPVEDAHLLPGEQVWSLLVESGGDAWIGTNNGLARLYQDAFTPLPKGIALRGQIVSTLLRDPAGSLWAGTMDAGVFRLARGRLTSFDTRHGLTHDIVRSLCIDREGSLWIGTDGGGLNRLRPGKFTPLRRSEGLSHDAVLTVMEDRSGALWVGTEGGGLNQIVGRRIRTFTTDDGLASDYIYALHEARDGTLWVGTTSGVCRRDGDRFRCLGTPDGLLGESVFSIHEDRGGTLWIGTSFGPNLLRDGRVQALADETDLGHELVRVMHEDRHGALWFGTDGGGLYRLADGRIEHFRAADGLSNTFILALHEDEAGTLWIGTKGGLCRRRDGVFECFTTAAGLHGDQILQILDDGQGSLWLGGLNGITQIRKASIDAFAAGTRATIDVQVYDERDGLPHREVNGGVEPSAWRSRDGRLWFATVGGLASVDPQHLPQNRILPPVTIERVFVNGEEVVRRSGVAFAPGSKDLTFYYTALSLSAPDRVLFQYWLEGNDDHWIDAGTRRQAYYTNLEPGTYRLHVRASNNDGFWNEAGATFSFQIEPFFYQTPWFYLLCALVVGLLGLSFYHWRVHHLRARQSELTQLVEEQTHELREREHALQELNSNLEREVRRQLDLLLEERRRYERELIQAKEKAEESARLKTAILRNMSHEIRTPITAILGFAHVLTEEVDPAQQEFVTYITENGRRLLGTLNSILDLAKLETDHVLLHLEPIDLCGAVRDAITLLSPIARRKSIRLRAELPEEDVVCLLDRNGVERILQNLVGNALKFTDAGEVVVSVARRDDGRVLLQVRDTGIGISEAFLPHVFEEFKQESTGLARSHEGSGLGLAITRRLVEAMGGTIEVESVKHSGATFTVALPRSVPRSGGGHFVPAMAAAD